MYNMVSVKQLEGDCAFLKENNRNGQLQCHVVALKGSKTPLYRMRAPLTKGIGACGGFTCDVEEGQNLLGTLLLAQWEDRAWKGRLQYDVTSCETKVIVGWRKFIAQLNEKWSSNSQMLLGNPVIQALGPSKRDGIKVHREDILLCITTGESERAELMSSAMVPRDGILVIINANPVEYGHIYLVPHEFHCHSEMLDKRSLECIIQIAVEVEDCSFRIFYDYAPSSNPGGVNFQANFFANSLPVELPELIPVYDDVLDKGLQIFEVAGYPIKTLVFTSKDNIKVLTKLVIKICSVLQERNAVFSLLISDSGRKFFLFPQIALYGNGDIVICLRAQGQSSSVRHLSAWECGGYFIFNKASEFDEVSEDEAAERLASVSLDDEDFQDLKRRCCSIADKLVP